MRAFPRKTVKIIPAMVILMVIPKRRMVSIIPEARPYISFCTELMSAPGETDRKQSPRPREKVRE